MWSHSVKILHNVFGSSFAPGAPATLLAGLSVLTLVTLAPLRTEAADAKKVPDAKTATYYGHVEAIFKERCVGCHAGERPKGRLNMETLEQFLEGGRKGEPVVPGKPKESLVFQLIVKERKPFMPPKKADAMTPEEIATVEAWILGGCRPGEKKEEDSPYSKPLDPPSYTRAPAVTALAYSADGNQLFVAGYREILVYGLGADGARPGPPQKRLVGESESIHALRLSPDGKLLAAVGGSAARFGELQLWDTQSHELVRFVRMGTDCLYAAAFSRDGKRIAVAGTDRALHVLNVESGEELYASEIHSDWVFGVAFSEDGTRLASAGRDKTVKVSEAKDGKFLKNLATLEGAVMRVVPRPGSQQFLVGADSNQAILYDAKEGKEIRKLENQPGSVLAAAFNSDGKLLAISGSAKEVRVYEADGGKLQHKLEGATDWVYALVFRPDGKRLAASGYDGIVRVYDLQSGKEEVSFVSVPIGRLQRF